jgi:glycosyltransferase involved in cell wall biosynthesis
VNRTVLHVEAGMHLYGGALQVFYLLSGLAQRPLRNVLVCPVGSAIAAAAADVVDKVYEVPMQGDLDIGFISRLRRIIKTEQADLVHLHSRRGADVLGGIAAKLEKCPCVLSRRVDNPESKLIAGMKYRLYDRVITISNGIRDVLLREGVPAAKVICVHSAVDADRFDRPAERDWFLHEFDLSDDAKVLGVIAQLIPRKGHRHLFAALPEVLTKHPEIRVLLFGKGPLHDELQQQIDQQGLHDNVRLIGFRDDLERILPCLYGVVHPADMEGLGVSLLQAAAAGVPLIGTDAGGIPEIVRNNENGILVPPGDVAQLREALLRLLADEVQASRFGEAGKQIVRNEFSIEVMVEGNYRVYQSLLE